MVGEVKTVEPVPAKAKLKALTIDVGGDSPLSIVTNASNVAERTVGCRVVVATVGAQVGDVKVAKTSVGGVSSEGMLCDGAMLSWSGGSEGVAVVLPASFAIGTAPPASRPRGDGGGSAPAPAPSASGRADDSLFARKPSKEEKKAAAKAAKEARKAKKSGIGPDESEPAQAPAAEPTPPPPPPSAAESAPERPAAAEPAPVAAAVPPALPCAADSPLTEPDVPPEAEPEPEVKDEVPTDPGVSALFAKKKKKPAKK